MHNLKHYQVLHEQNLIMTVKFEEVPRVPKAERLRVTPLVEGFWREELRYGFMDEPGIPKALEQCSEQGLAIDQGAVSYFLSREIVVPTPGSGMARWRESLFATMSRNAGSVVELGTCVQI